MHIAELERTLKSGEYTCDICSHSGVYGFVIYTYTDYVSELVSWDFGYSSRELAESSALACILRRTNGVSVKDYTTVFNDSESDCESSGC